MKPLRFLDFDKLCVRGPRAPLPAEDCFGQATGSQYKLDRRNLPKPGSSRHGGILSIRGGPSLIHHGSKAKPINMLVLTSPYVRDIRTYVPMRFPHRKAEKGNKPHAILERLAAVELKSRPGTYHFHVMTTTAPLNERNIDDLQAMGVSVESLLPDQFSALRHENAEQCYARLMGFNVHGMDSQACAMASRWCESRRQGSMVQKLGAILEDIAAEVAMSERERHWVGQEDPLRHADLDDAVMFMFSAIVLGHLVPDPRYSWDPYKKFHLLRR